jgi:hypothetical protein
MLRHRMERGALRVVIAAQMQQRLLAMKGCPLVDWCAALGFLLLHSRDRES